MLTAYVDPQGHWLLWGILVGAGLVIMVWAWIYNRRR
jgi:hypothetical protein